MTALGKLVRTTVFKLSLAYLVIFAVGCLLLMARVGYTASQLIDDQIAENTEGEITALTEQYTQGGLRRLVSAIERRVGQPSSSVYLVTTYAGETIAGNVAAVTPGALDRPGVANIAYERVGGEGAPHRAVARVFVLPGGFRLLVGRDLEDRERLRDVLLHTLVTSLIWLTIIGVAGGVFVAARVLRRVDALNQSARTIMLGDLTQRLPLARTGDELDRLAMNLNAMLERISELMLGLREVSDNIAHDLKTPLTRLRNRADDALRADRTDADRKAALERIIAESDGLIRTFDALLMIARLEAGSVTEGMEDFDLSAVARDVVELYEPLAEDRGVALSFEGDEGLGVHGNRELLARALANLVDNALKYGGPDSKEADAIVLVRAGRLGDAIRIEVADRGDGVPAADRARVLERFVRLETSRSAPGAGLGLSLVSAVAHLHKGSLRLEDNEPGLRAVLELPALKTALAPAASTPALVAS